jgi:hypothetical protein
MPYDKIDKQDVEKILKNHSEEPQDHCRSGAANVATFTIQFPTKGVRKFELYMSPTRPRQRLGHGVLTGRRRRPAL